MECVYLVLILVLPVKPKLFVTLVGMILNSETPFPLVLVPKNFTILDKVVLNASNLVNFVIKIL